jgi:hypothetical protein
MAPGAALEAMACRGCAAKLAASPLASALARLPAPPGETASGGPALRDEPPGPLAKPDLGHPVGRNQSPKRSPAPTRRCRPGGHHRQRRTPAAKR